MKTTPIIIGIGAVAALAAIWLGRSAWRTHHNLVTLHVRNAPLADVVRSLERQTREKVRLDPKLDAKVTLDVKNMPLGNVLDLLSEQAGARWGKTYAVYDSASALRRLESVFRGEAKLDDAGWTNLAPRFGESDMPGVDALGAGSGPIKVITRSPDGTGSSGALSFQSDEDVQKFIQDKIKDGASVTHSDGGTVRTVTGTSDGAGGTRIIRMSPNGTIVEKNGPDIGSGHPMKNLTVRRVAGPGGITTTTTDGDGRVKTIKTSPDGVIIKTDEWTSERLVMETLLSSRLGEAVPAKATPETAAKAASKVRGRYVTYYALEKPPIAGDAGMGRMVRSMSQRSLGIGGTNNPLANGDIRERVAAEARQRRLEDLAKSPEQQVQRARQKQEAQSGK